MKIRGRSVDIVIGLLQKSFALGGIVLIGLLYWKPLRTYARTHAVLDRREAEVARP